MKVAVCVKQVSIVGDEIIFDPDGGSVALDYLDHALNEWDASAVEHALQLRETVGGEVIAVTCGNNQAEAGLRRCLAMGVDRAIRVESPTRIDPFSIAGSLAPVLRDEAPSLVLCGAQSSDSVQAATGTALAGLLDLPVVAVARQLRLDESGREASVHRELDGGWIEVVDVDLPAVITVQTGSLETRYVNFRAIKQAAQLEIAVHGAVEDGGVAFRVRRMFVPVGSGSAEMLGDDALAVAQRIAAILEERVP